ncbi:hypothetical protein Hanom_Chr12g01092341 [Helianthus anomalus]
MRFTIPLMRRKKSALRDPLNKFISTASLKQATPPPPPPPPPATTAVTPELPAKLQEN